jgi:hypothetical protein
LLERSVRRGSSLKYGLPGVVDSLEDVDRVSGSGIVDGEGGYLLCVFVFEILVSGVGVVTHVGFPAINSGLFAFLLDGLDFGK